MNVIFNIGIHNLLIIFQQFNGPKTRYKTSVNVLPTPITTRCIAMVLSNVMSLRWELLGCKHGNYILFKMTLNKVIQFY